MRVFKNERVQIIVQHIHCIDHTHICVDATNRNGKHTKKIRIWYDDETNQVTHSEDHSEETRLNGTTNKSVKDRIRPLETSSRTREHDDQCN